MIKESLNQMEQAGSNLTDRKKFNNLVNIKVNLDKIVHSNDIKLENGSHNDLHDPTYSYNSHINGILENGKTYVSHSPFYDKLNEAIKLASISKLGIDQGS